MANAHRANVLVTSCLKTPVDPHTKAPLALYERERALPYSASHMDNRDYEKEMEYDDSGSELGDGQPHGKGSPLMIKDYRVTGEHIDLREFYFSNEEYYRKLEELKRSHLCTMAELENMYRKKLQLKGMAPLGEVEGEHRLPWMKGSPAAIHCLKKSHSALELRRGSGVMDTSDEEGAADVNVEKGLLSSPKEHIKNMWQDFKLSPHHLHLSSSSLQSLPGDRKGAKGLKGRKKGREDTEREPSKPRVTVPKPFHMTVREAEKRRHGVKTRSEIELENADLRRQLEELTECQRQFRASPMPAHVRLRLFEELQERDEARRRTMKEREERRHRAAQRPFSFLERERQKKEQREEQLRQVRSSAEQERVKPFKAKPVPKAVYEAASGEQMKEEQLYRAIKMQMRAKEMLHSASMPPSMLARRLSERKRAKGDGGEFEEDNSSPHRPKINTEVPDFDASYRRFRKQLENRRELKPVTTCEPFQLRTSQIASHRERVLEDIEKDQSSPRATRWPYVSPRLTHTPNSSLCSSLSGSMELLPAKATDAAKKRQEAVRKVLEQRKKAEEDEESWRERQKQREKKLQKVVSKRAQANDPHLALSQTCQTKLKQFRKQDLQRRKEYQEEMKEMQQRVKGRPLLLEQVAQRNAKQAAEKRYTDALRGCGLSEDFVSSKVPMAQRPHSCDPARRASTCSDSKQSDKDLDVPVVYNKVYLDDYPDDDEDMLDHEAEEVRTRDKLGSKTGHHDGAVPGSDNDHYSDDDRHSQGEYNYSDDDEHYSEDSEHNLSADERNEESDIVKKCQSRLSNRSGQYSRTSQYSETGESRAKSDKN